MPVVPAIPTIRYMAAAPPRQTWARRHKRDGRRNKFGYKGRKMMPAA
jgi:hypothetical protein